MRDLPLTLLRALAAVYETGGIRPAGRLLGVQHSAVSRALRDLEAWTAVPLIERRAGKRGLSFTPEGAALGKSALEAMGALEAAAQAAREATNANSVTLATTPSFAMRWLLPRLPSFNMRHPKIEVSILVDQARRSPVQTGADLNIRMGPGGPDDRDAIALMDEQVFPVLSPGLWAELGQPTALQDLVGVPLLHDRDPSTSWADWRRAVGLAELDVRRGPRFTSSDLILRAAEQGQGVALARGRLAQDRIDDGALLRPFEGALRDLGTNYWLLPNPETGRRRAVQAVIAWLLEEAVAQSAPMPRAVENPGKH